MNIESVMDLISDIWSISDISNIIFSLCNISDKRNLIRTCRRNYLFTSQMPKYEKQFKKIINETNLFRHMTDSFRFTRLYTNVLPLYQLFSHSIELIYDKNEHLIPDRYICQENRILFMYPNIYKLISQRGNLSLLQKMVQIKHVPERKLNGLQMSRGAALGNHLHILDWMESYPKNNPFICEVDSGYQIDEEITAYAALGNNFELLKAMLDRGVGQGFKIYNITIENAIKVGNDEMINWLLLEQNINDYFSRRSEYKFCPNAVAKAAIEQNRMDIIELLQDKFEGQLIDICNNAIKKGNIEIIKWGLSHGYEITTDTYSDYISGGHIHVLEWLKENNYINGRNPELSRRAAFAGNLEVFKWAKSNNFLINPDVQQIAIQFGYFDFYNWANQNKCGYTINSIYHFAMLHADKHKMENKMKSMSEKNLLIYLKLCYASAWNGKLSMLKLLREKGYEWDSDVCYRAVKNGHLKYLKWAHENGCEWNATVCAATATYNNIEILKWLRKNGCPWDHTLCSECVYFNNIEMLEWMINNGFEWDDECKDFLSRKVGGNRPDIIAWRDINKVRLGL